jgi:hypothetical protein
LLITVSRGSETLGYLAIDSPVDGRAQSGLRPLPDIDESAMRGLASAMTLKYGFLGLPQGGAKAGVMGDPEASLPERHSRLAAFGKAIAPLLRAGIYMPGTDMGTDMEDIRMVLSAAGVRPKLRQLRSVDSVVFTAISVLAGVQAGWRRAAHRYAVRRSPSRGLAKSVQRWRSWCMRGADGWLRSRRHVEHSTTPGGSTFRGCYPSPRRWAAEWWHGSPTPVGWSARRCWSWKRRCSARAPVTPASTWATRNGCRRQ